MMGDHDSPSTCLSTDPHGQPFRDTIHYFGCLPKDEKPDLKTPLRSKWDSKTLTPAETKLIENYQRKAFFDSLPSHKQQRIQIESQRITDLRTTFENDKDHGYLVNEFQNELGKWRESQREGQIEISRASATAQPPREVRIFSKANAFGLSGNIMLFENSSNEITETSGYTGISDERFPDKFPNQRIPLKDLLYNKDRQSNPLMERCKEGTIRYFHLPGNNMEWIEVMNLYRGFSTQF
jgi:hypothetical protein